MRRALLAAAAMLTGLFLASPAVAGGGCHQPEATEGTGDTVEMRNACFGPTILRVEPGSTVTFVNRDEFDHDLSGVNLDGYDQLLPGASVQHRFGAEGTYPYMCHLHPGMTGVVIVGDGTGAGRAVALGSPALAAARPAGGDGAVNAAALTGSGVGGVAAGFVLALVLRRKGRVAEA